MGILDRWFGIMTEEPTRRLVHAMAGDGGLEIRTPSELDQALRRGELNEEGQPTAWTKAMRVAAVYACVRIISGAVATMPIDIKRRVDDRTRVDATDTSIYQVLRRRPNSWQKPAQFKRMLQAHVCLRGNGYAKIVRSLVTGDVIALIPLHPDRMTCEQRADQSLRYTYTHGNGSRSEIPQNEVLHLIGLTLDGVHGVSPITFARETIGLALGMERHGATMFHNGARMSGVFKHPGKLSEQGHKSLSASLDAYRQGGAREGKDLLLEEGMSYERMAMTAEDAQWIENRKFSRSDIAMFFGVPPHMIGDTEKSTSWGTGIIEQRQGFVDFSLEDHLTMWEEGINVDCIGDDQPDLYARFNRSASVKGDIKARWEAHVKALQWGVRSPNEIRALEDENPREGGDIYYPPPNTAGGEKTDPDDDPKKDDADAK